MDNPLIGLLRTYGPSAASSSLFDEHVREEVRKQNVKGLEIESPLLAEIGKIILGPEPQNVILTGTAGDGKTFHIRQAFLKELGGRDDEWPGEVIKSVDLPNGRALRIIRDLTEVPQERKAEEITHITNCLLGRDTTASYLVAANDGQLLTIFREAMEGGGEDAEDHAKVYKILSEMLRNDHQDDKSGLLSLKLFNLSRNSDPGTLDRVIDAMVEHEQWDLHCKTCDAARDPEMPCPILLNRSLLRGNADAPDGRMFRKRLGEVLDLAASNDKHVPIRQLFALVSNIILGDNKVLDRPLLDCATARMIKRDGSYSRTNPYSNALGLNLREERRSNNAIFSILDTFGLGHETNNAIDDLLLERRPQHVIDALGIEDRFYGEDIFSMQRSTYMQGTHENYDPKAFGEAMRAQRRRIFFRLPSFEGTVVANGPSLDPWALTIFHHAGIYLRFRDAVKSGSDKSFVDSISKLLVKGLNRTLTGLMTDDTDSLWLAGAIGRTDNPTGRVVTQDQIPRKPPAPYFVSIKHSLERRRPALTVATSYTGVSLGRVPELDLRVIIFEYLMRVAAGSLPSSFSRQCHQEVRRFAMMLSRSLSTSMGAGDIIERVGILSVKEHGVIHRDNIEVGS